MPTERISLSWLLILALAATGKAHPQNAKDVTVSRADLCVTEGAVEQLPERRLSVATPKMRAYVNLETPPEP